MRDSFNIVNKVQNELEPHQIILSEKIIWGCSKKSNFFDELNINTSKVPRLLNQFQSLTHSNEILKKRYVVYSNFDNEIPREYAISVASDNDIFSTIEELRSIKIISGNYLKFNLNYSTQEMYIQKWLELVSYFASADCKFTRAFRTDFELHSPNNNIDIHISVL